MKRKIDLALSEWKAEAGHKPLILIGCRQIGKTYSVLEFVSRNYDNHIYINFETSPEKKSIFKGDLSTDALIPRLMLSEKVSLHPGTSAIVLDEIQACTDAYSALKPLSASGYDVICTGSFLGVNLDDHDRLSPMGFVKIMTMHPMDFEEYLWATGIEPRLIDEVKSNIRARAPVDEFFNNAFMEQFLVYTVVGGMPAAVSEYITTKDYTRAMAILKDIVRILMKDAGKYSKKSGRLKINACLKSVPDQLARENKRFIYSDVEKIKGSGTKNYGNSIDWLNESGLVSKCHCLEEPVKPLSVKRMDGVFKLYMADTGIMMALMGDSDPANVVLRDPYSNNGSVMENAVASALMKKGYDLYYYMKRDSTLEIDFVLDAKETVTLLDMKSGRNPKSKSLNTLMAEKKRSRTGIKLMNGNVEVDERGILHMPLYAPCFFEDSVTEDFPPPTSAELINKEYEMRGMSSKN